MTHPSLYARTQPGRPHTSGPSELPSRTPSPTTSTFVEASCAASHIVRPRTHSASPPPLACTHPARSQFPCLAATRACIQPHARTPSHRARISSSHARTRSHCARPAARLQQASAPSPRANPVHARTPAQPYARTPMRYLQAPRPSHLHALTQPTSALPTIPTPASASCLQASQPFSAHTHPARTPAPSPNARLHHGPSPAPYSTRRTRTHTNSRGSLTRTQCTPHARAR